MKRLLKWTGPALLALALGVAVLFGFAWTHSERLLAQRHAIEDPPIATSDDPAVLAHGRHLYETRGCADCHGPDGSGRLLFDAPPLRAVPSNLTPPALAARGYTPDSLAAAIRHGVRPDGTPLLLMPAGDYIALSDADTAALVSYVRTLPPSANDPGTSALRPLGRLLLLLTDAPFVPAATLDHAPRRRDAPAPAASAEYGAYVAQVCTGCHGADFSGGIVHGPPGSPPSSNLTPHASGLAAWSEADFVRTMRQGVRPDGRQLSPTMPWQMVAKMTDTELAALWAYFRTLEPKPTPR